MVAVGPPKDQRLGQAIAAHARAKVRTLGWAVAVVEGVYADFESLAARLGGLGMVALCGGDDTSGPGGRITVPDVTFSFLHNKYGSRQLVDEYVGSLVNTLSAWQLVGYPTNPHDVSVVKLHQLEVGLLLIQAPVSFFLHADFDAS